MKNTNELKSLIREYHALTENMVSSKSVLASSMRENILKLNFSLPEKARQEIVAFTGTLEWHGSSCWDLNED